MSYVTVAANWAESVSAVAATAGVLATLLVGWWAWRAAVPHRKMAYSIEFTPLLSSTHSGLSVSLGTERLTHPQTATLKVINVGNREIEAAQFNGESIEFGMNARIVSVLASRSTDNRRVPPPTIHGNTLQIDPYVIHKGQEISYKLLLDGANARLTLRHSLSASFKADTRGQRAHYGTTFFVTVAAMVGLVAIVVPTFMSSLVEMPSKEEIDREVKQVRQSWYEKGRRDGERSAKGPGHAGSSAPKSPSAVPSPSRS